MANANRSCKQEIVNRLMFVQMSPPIVLYLRNEPSGMGGQGDVSQPNRGVSHFFRERSRLCRGPFRDCSSLVLFIGREREKGRIGKIPGPSPSKSGKSQKNRESPKKDKKVQIGKPPRLKHPRLAALDKLPSGGQSLFRAQSLSVVSRCCRGALLETGSQDPVATRAPT